MMDTSQINAPFEIPATGRTMRPGRFYKHPAPNGAEYTDSEHFQHPRSGIGGQLEPWSYGGRASRSSRRSRSRKAEVAEEFEVKKLTVPNSL